MHTNPAYTPNSMKTTANRMFSCSEKVVYTGMPVCMNIHISWIFMHEENRRFSSVITGINPGS